MAVPLLVRQVFSQLKGQKNPLQYKLIMTVFGLGVYPFDEIEQDNRMGSNKI
jgi:hypothetical protein